jgi:PIN domain nuclease of toxin-antitoxin system
MKLLLDTHVVLWWLDNPLLLADAARIEIANSRNAVFVSAICIQEIVLKQARNRLECSDPVLPLVAVNRFSPLPITLDHAQAMRDLPPLHKDPFDRQLVAQAHVEGMTLVTRDAQLAKYGIPVLEA